MHTGERMTNQRLQIKVAVTPVFETELKVLAARENRSLSNFCESLLVDAVRRLKFGESRHLMRDGRSIDQTSDEEVDRG